MANIEDLKQRKKQHIKIVLDENVEPTESSFAKYRLPYSALPEISMDEIDLTTEFLGFKVDFPFIISSMTGGQEKSGIINKNLAKAAQITNIPLGLGSMRIIIKHPESAKDFQVKHLCPNVPLFANVGLVQLNYGFGINEINKIIDTISADGIFLHINHLQEAIQPEGDTNYKDLLKKLEKIIHKIKVPIIVKEVGSGIDFRTAKRLNDIGINWIDVAGTGGTSWSWVEGYRRNDDLGFIFRDTGIPTDECLVENSKIKGLNLIAGGGIRSGLDIAKSLMLGAKMATAAKPLLEPALNSDKKVVLTLNKLKHELRVAMFACGVKSIRELTQQKLYY